MPLKVGIFWFVMVLRLFLRLHVIFLEIWFISWFPFKLDLSLLLEIIFRLVQYWLSSRGQQIWVFLRNKLLFVWGWTFKFHILWFILICGLLLYFYLTRFKTFFIFCFRIKWHFVLFGPIVTYELLMVCNIIRRTCSYGGFLILSLVARFEHFWIVVFGCWFGNFIRNWFFDLIWFICSLGGWLTLKFWTLFASQVAIVTATFFHHRWCLWHNKTYSKEVNIYLVWFDLYKYFYRDYKII